MRTILLGIVKDVEDPLKLGRIRCEVYGRTNGLDKEALPWYIPRRNKDAHDLPALEETVEITLISDDILVGYWNMLPQSNKMEIEDDDYKSAKVLLYRDLADNEDEGIVEISYRKSIGLTVKLRESEVTQRPDGSIFLKTKFDNRTVHICEDSISLGTETKSAEPGVLGAQNEDALKKILELFKAISKAAGGSPYTTTIKAAIDPLTPDLEQQIPKTKSEHITLD